MQAAIEAVKSGSGINRAALDNGVPPSILKDGISGRVVGESSGRKRSFPRARLLTPLRKRRRKKEAKRTRRERKKEERA
jgi:hypothetical protein